MSENAVAGLALILFGIVLLLAGLSLREAARRAQRRHKEPTSSEGLT